MNIKIENLWSVEAEAAVLGSMLIEPKCIGSIIALLDEKDFYLPEHQTIFICIMTLFVAGVPVESISLRTELKCIGKLDEIGGVAYIGKILDSTVSSANAMYYAGVVLDRSQYRQIVNTAEKINKVVTEPLTVSEQVQRIQELVLSLEHGKPEKEYFSFAQDAENIAAELNENKTCTPTGLRNLDFIIDGFYPGELIVVAGRPSMGKSALAAQLAINMAKSGLAITYFSLEMTARGLIERALKQHTVSELNKMDVVIHERCDTPEKMIAFIKTRKQSNDVDVVVVDYLQLMTSGIKNENRVQEISTISRKLKLAAMQENVPVIALSQLNRAVESRDRHRPRLSDLRESGAIEQDADIVMLIHREDVYRRQENPQSELDGATELIVAKNRRGRTGIADLVFLDSKVMFGDKLRV
jgi:replicative DNA helicase